MPASFDVVRSSECDRDLELIFDHLASAYRDFGEERERALDRAATRVRAIEDDLERLGRVPFQGTIEPQILSGLRHVTKDQAVFYFTVEERAKVVRVLGVFFGGQDHRRQILSRIASHKN